MNKKATIENNLTQENWNIFSNINQFIGLIVA